MIRIGVLILIIFSLVFTIACNSDDNQDFQSTKDQNSKGLLPSLSVGDTWTQSGFKLGDIEYSKTVTIIDNNTVQEQECYIARVTSDPPIIPNAIAALDKKSMDVIQIEIKGEFNEAPFESNTVYSYTYSDLPFPVYLGKSWTEVVNVITSTTVMGESTNEINTEESSFRVESLERISVDAGDFDCFKIEKYDKGDKKLATYWYSDNVKSNVKIIDFVTGEVIELASYSLNASF